MLDLFGNHIVGFSTRWLIVRVPFQAVFFDYAVWFVPFLDGKL